MSANVREKSFLLAWAPVNEAALAVFAQVLSISLKSFFSIYH